MEPREEGRNRPAQHGALHRGRRAPPGRGAARAGDAVEDGRSRRRARIRSARLRGAEDLRPEDEEERPRRTGRAGLCRALPADPVRSGEGGRSETGEAGKGGETGEGGKRGPAGRSGGADRHRRFRKSSAPHGEGDRGEPGGGILILSYFTILNCYFCI